MSTEPESTSQGYRRPATQRPTALTPPRKPGNKKRLANGLVALSSAAVIAVYAAGYARTAPAASLVYEPPLAAVVSTLETTTPTATNVPPTTTTSAAVATATTPAVASSGAAAAPTATATAVAPTATTAAATATATQAATSAYRDGTYTGSGTSRHGGVTVAVVIKNGRIVSAEITASNTRYPISRIANLPGEVVATQSANINYVSGATDSSMAFRTAVTNALAQAH